MAGVAAIPVRIRLTLAFAVVMAAVLATAGLFLYVRLGAALDRTIDRNLRERSSDVRALVHRGDARLAVRGDGLAQVLDPNGSLVGGTVGLDHPLLTRAEVSRAAAAPIVVRSRSVPASDEPARLLAAPVETPRGRVVVVVGESLGERADALESLHLALLIGGPLALLLSSLPCPAAATRSRPRSVRSSPCVARRSRCRRASRVGGSRSRPPATRSVGLVER